MTSVGQIKERSKWCLIGIPDHQAVLNVGGRAGAAQGPKAFRSQLSRLRHIQPLLASDFDVTGLGKDVVNNHRLASEAVQSVHRSQPCVSVVVGGGHDHGYSHLAGIREAFTTGSKPPIMGCINIDAHLDVRKPAPLITSGSPFYLALENGTVAPTHLIEFGIQDHSNTPELWAYARDKGVEIIGFKELRHDRAVVRFGDALKRLASRSDVIVISLDLDSIAAAFAPGVSAPEAEGFSPSEIFEMMELAGNEPKTASLGIFELNPEHDVDRRTALTGATAAYWFVSSALKIQV